MKSFLLVMALAVGAWGQNGSFHKEVLEPGESVTFTVSLLPPSVELTKREMALVRQRVVRLASKEECWIHVFPCRAGNFVTYECPKGYAMFNQWEGVIASSIPDGEATEVDVWDEDKRLPLCQNVNDWVTMQALHGKRGSPLPANIEIPVPKELR